VFKTYPLLPYWRAYLVLIFLLGLGLGAAFVWLANGPAGADAFNRGLLYVFALVPALLGLGVLLGGLQIRLEVAPAGLRFVALGYSVRAAWEQVDGYQTAPGCSGLHLRTPAVEVAPWLALLLKISGPVALLSALGGRYRPAPDLARAAECLPVQAFAQDYEHSALARELYRYVQDRSGAAISG
jgi:hypothetical protein